MKALSGGNKLAQVAWRTSLWYALAAAVWILVSDKLLVALVPDPVVMGEIAVCKGWAFVAVTALLLYGTLRGQLRHWEQEAAARRKAEGALRDSQTRLQVALESGRMGTWGWDIRSGMAWWDEATAKLFGRACEDVTGKGLDAFLAFVHDEDRRLLRELFQKAVDECGHCYGEFRITRPDGTILWIATRASVEGEADGRAWRMTGACVDITERKQAEVEKRKLEAQLLQAQKMEAIGQLSSGVAHDFNNILTVIHGNATLLLLPDLIPEEHEACTQQIIQATERASRLTRQLLLFSRKQVMQPAHVDLNRVVADVTKMLKRLLGEDIKLIARFGAGLPLVQGDAGMIEQVLLNLAVNARDAMPSGGQLTVVTSELTLEEAQARQFPEAKAGRYVHLSVSDTGDGIPAEILPRVFEPFFTTKESGKGTGLGLSIVQSVVRQHHGWVAVASEPGEGTTFRIGLPALEGVQSPAQAADTADAVPGGKETILVVEDEASLRLLVGNLLRRFGYTVLRAQSGAAALQVWNEHRDEIDLLLTDLVMPNGMTGFDLAQKLQGEKPLLKVIYTSGYTSKAGKGPPLVEGVNFLQKPYSSQKLARTVRDCLDQAGGAAE